MPGAAVRVLHGLSELLRLAINPRYSARAGPRAVFSRERSASTEITVEVFYHDNTIIFTFTTGQSVFHI